ncbi:hypothetical protein [uncultured Mailhella sp.]|uniref:hypothetical protein n=1 Tax=uncultured Mailhella sp. TaxID=1981031 RepID=UPI003208C038
MDAVSVASSSRLLEALERMGVSQGEGLISSGPSPVPDSLARAFERLMDQPEASAENALRSGQAAETQATSLPREEVSPDIDVVSDVSGKSTAATPAETPLPSPTELYRLQFQVAMLRHELDTGSQVAQKASQGLDSLLRNQS